MFYKEMEFDMERWESWKKSLVLFSFRLLMEPGVKGPGVVCSDGGIALAGLLHAPC